MNSACAKALSSAIFIFALLLIQVLLVVQPV
jgi:hypothetical protein